MSFGEYAEELQRQAAAVGTPVAMGIPEPPVMYAPPPPQGGGFKKFIIVGGLFFVLLLIGAMIAIGIYFYTRKGVEPAPPAEDCNSGNISLPTGEDTLGCSVQNGYNVYPLAKISAPAAPTQAFAPTSQYVVEEQTPIDMTGYYCSKLCDNTTGCQSAECLTLGEDDNASKCTCTGYTQVPTALVSDAKSPTCTGNNQCNWVYIKSSAVSK